MSRKKFNLFLLITIFISIILNATGCGDNVPLPFDKVTELLKHDGYSIERSGMSLRHPYNQRPWVCLAKKSQEEFLIVTWPSEKLDITQLGVDKKLTWEQMTNKLESQGYHEAVKLLFFDLSPTGVLYWEYHLQGGSKAVSMYFDLSGELISSGIPPS